MYFSPFHNTHEEDRHMERTYTLRRHTHGEDIHTEKTYTRKGHGGDTMGTYTRRGHTHGGDIHTERTYTIYTEETYTRRGHGGYIHTERTRGGTQTWKRQRYRSGIHVEGHTHKGTQKGRWVIFDSEVDVFNSP